MNKKGFIIFILVISLLVAIGIVYYFYSKNNNTNENNNEYEATRTSTENNEQEDTANNTINTNNDSSSQKSKITETTLATFSTKIYSTDPARQNNVNITCNTLNDTIVKNGEIFSFCNTVGQATTSKGYQKADIFDKDGNKKKGLRRRKLSSK